MLYKKIFLFLGRSVIEHVHHNHTYHLPAESSGSLQRPISRDKKGNNKETFLIFLIVIYNFFFHFPRPILNIYVYET